MKTCQCVVLIGMVCCANMVLAQERVPEKPQNMLVIALRNDVPPMSFLNVDGQITGLFVDIWNLWAAKTGQSIEFRAAAWQETLDALKDGQVDMIGALYYSEDRSAWMAFSQPLKGNERTSTKKLGKRYDVLEEPGKRGMG